MKRDEPEKPAKSTTPPKAEKTEDKPAPPSPPSPDRESTDEILSRSFMDSVRALADEDDDD